jgi:aminoglycoside 3-N-acetyltransferase
MNSTKVYTKQDIFAQLAAMGAPRDSIVLMHSSFRLVGKVEGGIRGLLDALIEYFTKDGGLFCVPAHTWHNLGCDITLDMNDPLTCLGALPNVAAADERGTRSQNPIHSMTVFGDAERAKKFVEGEAYVSSGTSPESCYGKLYNDGGFVLLVGVSHSKNTFLHCVDEMIGMPNRLCDEPVPVKVKTKSGEIIFSQLKYPHTDYTPDISRRFPQYETAFRYHGAIRDGFVGNAPTQLCDARIMKDTVELIFKNMNGADPLADEAAIDPKLYC